MYIITITLLGLTHQSTTSLIDEAIAPMKALLRPATSEAAVSGPVI